MSFTIGSLFDGSGGFPLAAFMCGGTPVWASEIEPYPIAVTKTRFPYMKHLGSVTDIKGNEIEPVDVITFGSPCQDLSVAGKRAGLKHTENGDEETTRSGLFMDAVRIIKEMREATNGKYPNFAVWENVPGAFSSNKGEGFRIVLEELIKIVEPTAVMPPVPKNGWAYADNYCGDGWSIAYRVLDAQYWGVPQRRRRIYLVLDLGGECAGEVLFERDGLRGYFEEGRTPWQAAPGDAESGIGADDREGNCVGFDVYNMAVTGDVAKTLTSIKSDADHVPVVYGISPYHSNCMKSSNPHSGIYVADTARTLDAMNCGYPACNQGGIAVVEPLCMATQQGGAEIMEGKCPTITAAAGMSGNNQPVVCYKDMCLDDQGGSQISVRGDGKCPTLMAEMHGNIPAVMEPVVYDGAAVTSPINASNPRSGDPCHTLSTDSRNYVCYAMQSFGDYKESDVGSGLKARDYKDATDLVVAGVDCRNMTEKPELYPTLQAKPNGGQSLNYSGAVRIQYIVRRLTPTECARLQGFPDDWAHPDKKDEFSDEEYKFWLNVRNNHAEINGKAVKDYSKDQTLNWYNKLHTDSAEYKLWGNGIALPCALYVMQGISEVFARERN